MVNLEIGLDQRLHCRFGSRLLGQGPGLTFAKGFDLFRINLGYATSTGTQKLMDVLVADMSLLYAISYYGSNSKTN
jgi:hypothetical protein